MEFDYFYGPEDAEQYQFYRIPKLLITSERFKDVSVESKLLYGLVLDRLSLSIKNGWFDSLNRAYIIYTIEDVTEDMHCGSQKAVKLVAEPEKKAGLIKKKRQGLGKPSLIYVLKFSTVCPQNTSESLFKNGENHNSGNVKITTQEFPNSQPNKTNQNQTENTAKACGQRFLPMATQLFPSRIWPVRAKTARIYGRMRKRPSANAS